MGMKSRPIFQAIMAWVFLLTVSGQPLGLCHGAPSPCCQDNLVAPQCQEVLSAVQCPSHGPCGQATGKCECCGALFLAAERPFQQSFLILPYRFFWTQPILELIPPGIFHPPRS